MGRAQGLGSREFDAPQRGVPVPMRLSRSSDGTTVAAKLRVLGFWGLGVRVYGLRVKDLGFTRQAAS